MERLQRPDGIRDPLPGVGLTRSGTGGECAIGGVFGNYLAFSLKRKKKLTFVKSYYCLWYPRLTHSGRIHLQIIPFPSSEPTYEVVPYTHN